MDLVMVEFIVAIGLLAFFLWVQYTGKKMKKEEYLRQLNSKDADEE